MQRNLDSKLRKLGEPEGFDPPTSNRGNQLWQQSGRDLGVPWGQDSGADTFPPQMGLQKQEQQEGGHDEKRN